MRFDPVWRRIKPDTYTTKFEGQFPTRLDRLEGLNNWGCLGWLYGHATASKRAHHFGLEWNAIKFLDGDGDRAKHRASFRTAAHVAHWGHLPISYAAEEAVLRAAHVDANARSAVDAVLADVIAFGSLSCDKNHDCAAAIRSADRPFDFYRWLSAWLVKQQWTRIWKAIKAASDVVVDEAETKSALIETLVCGESRGFKILKRCNQADYVPRDLLQAGTAWVTFDIEALWEGNPLGSDAAKEWSLVDAAQTYLNDRFFHSPEALLFHSLVARAIAGGLLADGVTPAVLAALTLETDDHFNTKLKPYHRDRLLKLQSQTGARIGEQWALVGAFSDVSLNEGTRFEMEDQLSGAKGRSRVSYPFNVGVSVVVEPGSSTLPEGLDFAGAGRRLAMVHVHHESPSEIVPAGRPVLNVVAKISDRVMPGHELGDNVMSWLLGNRVQQRSSSVDRICAEIATAKTAELQSEISTLLAMKSLQEVLKHRMISGLLSALADSRFPLGQRSRLAGLLLRLPWACARYTPGRRMLGILKTEALGRASAAKGRDRGYALETAVAADQLLEASGPRYRFVFLGATSIGKDGQPVQEWDVLRLDLDASAGWSLTAIECAVARNKAKDAASRTKFELLQGRLAGRFSDLTTYQTLLATVGEGDLQYEDAGRSWSKV